MSHAFVKETDEQWLYDVAPTLQALSFFLTRENNGVRVYEKSRSLNDKTGNEVFHMSNSLSYTKDADGQWMVL